MTEVCGVALDKVDLRRLSKPDVLNDKVIRAYLRLVVKTASAAGKHIILSDSYFIEQLQRSGYKAVEHSIKKDQLITAWLWFLPVNTDKIHWSLIVVDFSGYKIGVYDSLLWESKRYVDLVILFLKQKGTPFDQCQWDTQFIKDIPVQKNGTDCGVFLCQYAKHLAFSRELLFSQNDIPEIRQQMLQEFFNSKLHWSCKRTLQVTSDDSEHVKQPKLETSTPKPADSASLLITKVQARSPQPKAPALHLETSSTMLPKDLQSIIPSQYSYFLESYESLPKRDFLGAPLQCFKATFYVNVDSEATARQWIAEFEQASQNTYRILGGSKTMGSIIAYKTVRHCQHYRKYFPKDKTPKWGEDSLRQKKTDCPSRLTLRVYCKRPNVLKKIPRSDHFCEVQIVYDHDHPINSAHVLSFRDVSEGTKNMFFEYFKCGHSAASARHEHELRLQLSTDPVSIKRVLADRSTNPNVQDVSRMFDAWQFQQHESEGGVSMFDHLEREVEAYNSTYNDEGGKAIVQRFIGKSSDVNEGQPFVLAICSPIMNRAHKYIRQSSELVFMDATSSLDRFSCPTYIISTGSAAGAILLGVFVLSNETTATITKGLNLLKSILPSHAFFNKGSEVGPALFITDELASQREALRNVWPNARLLLCLFHYLQRWWKWLWEGKQGIDKDDRKEIMQFVRKLVYTKEITDLSTLLSEEIKDPSSIIAKYSNVLKRVKDMQENEEEWAIAHRYDITTRGKHTNNYSEASVRILKDRVFERTRAYNLVQMFQFLSKTLELYFEKRLLDVAHNRPSTHLKLPSSESEKIKEPAFLEKLGETMYRFQYTNDHTRNYLVDVELGVCSCPVGISGSPCKHQAFAIKELSLPSVNFVPQYSTEGRRLFAIIALGENKIPDTSFFASVHQKEYGTSINEQSNDQGGQHISHLGKGDSSEVFNSEHEVDSKNCDGISEEHINDSGPNTQKFIGGLKTIFDDMCSRLKESDQNYISGVENFIHRYNNLQEMTISTPSIASALHTFSTEGFTRKHQRSSIPVQSSALARRRKGVPRGRKPVPQGRPPKLAKAGKENKDSFVMKKFKPRKSHNLALSI